MVQVVESSKTEKMTGVKGKSEGGGVDVNTLNDEHGYISVHEISFAIGS